MNTYAIYFWPRGSLATWPLSSDMLFGAVCWGIHWLGLMNDIELEQWLKEHEKAPPFAFSHAFPVFWEEKSKSHLRCYPLPANFQPGWNDLDVLVRAYQQKSGVSSKAAKAELVRTGKQFKTLNYVSEGVLANITTRRLSAADAFRALLFKQGEVTMKDDILYTHDEAKTLPEKLMEKEAMQHNQIDRLAGSTVEGMLFYREETFFAPNAGLWAVLRAESRDFESYIQPALRYLADTGLGADRTAGKGHFDIEVQSELSIPSASSPQVMMNLSHYIPLANEFRLDNEEQLAYRLKTLRPKREQKYPRPLPAGVRSMPIYKQATQVFEPGSVFPYAVRKEIYGQLVRLTPNNHEPVYQSGAALMVYL
jgi:CRISPR type III-A-associated RAMP protein Csm4